MDSIMNNINSESHIWFRFDLHLYYNSSEFIGEN